MSGSQHTHSWSKEFQKRRHAFEQRMEGDPVFEEEEEEESQRLRAIAAVKHNTEEGMGTRRLRSPPSGRDTPTHSSDSSSMNAQSHSISSPSPTWPTSAPFMTSPRHYSVEVNFTSREPQRQRAPFDGNFEDEEDQLAPLGTSPGTFNRRSLSSRRVVAIGEETGQKETVIPYCTETTSPAFSSQSQSDDSEREDSGLSAQIAILRNQNRQLVRQLREREEERDGLREQLETHQQEKSLFSPPPGLPSRVLDGRKVLREREVKAEAVAILRARLPSSSGSSKALGSPRRKNFDELGDVERSSERELLAKIESLKREHAQLESHLREISEDKRRIEKELKHHQEAFVKVQEREQELLKDIEVLRDENSHHSGAISKLQAERESLQSENITLQDELTTATEKLHKTEKCYKEVEHENLALEAEIEHLMRDKKHLFEEKQKLQSAVEDARKTKENFRSTIRQLREQNLSLESQVGESTREHKAAVFKQEKAIKLRETKEQQTLREVMMLREERSQLKEKLVSAQQEIDSLEAQWKENQSTNQIQAELSVSLSEVQMELAALRKGLKSTRRDVSSLPTKQHDVVQEQFMVLVQKSKETLAAAEHDKTKLSEALELSETSLAKLDADFQKIKVENAKLLSQKGAISAEVSKLQSEVATLQDQKRLLEVQLVQNDSISHQQETKVQELEAQRKKLEEKLSSSERLWKNKFGWMEREWEGKLAEANLEQENLSEERESLLQEKASLEKQLSPLVQENEKLESGKRELESQIELLRSKISEFSSKVRTNDSHISEAQRIMGRMIAEKACLVAEMRESKLEYEAKISASEQMYNKDIDSAAVETKQLKESLATAEEESQKIREQLEQISKKETGIGQMTSQLEAMTTENAQLKTEVKALEEKHQTAIKELQQLAEKEQTRHLHNEKLKMTLTTEIGLLKSKLKSVEDDKTALEGKLMEFSKETASAFQAIPESKQVEQLRQQIVTLQLTSRDQNTQFGDFQNRSVVLETENKRLKDAARSSKDALEANTALRKQVSEMSRKIFFLESGTKTLTDQVHTLQNSLKVAREMKERSTNERVKKLTEENQVLQDRVRNLEEDRTKKLMAADLKIVEAVKESDKLRQRLSSIRSSFEGQQRSNVEDVARSLKTESEVLHKMKVSLSSSREDLKHLEANQQKILALHLEIQQLLAGQTPHVASGRSATWSRGTSQTLPKVLQSLPPGYVSSLQGSSGFSQGRPSMSSPLHISSFELQEKLSHLHAFNSGLADRWKRHQVLLQERESEAGMLEERFSALKVKLERLAKENEELQESIASIQDSELKPEQLQVISTLQKQIETLQDQVIDRDMALQDIELQMKKDYEMHDRNFASLKTQVLEFREQLSAKDNLIRTKDQYIQQTEERCLEYEGQTLKARKDLERALQEREQLIPENLQRSGLSNMSDVIRVQDEELRRLQKALAEFSFEISQLQSQFDSMQREKSVLQSKAIEMERMHIQMKEGMSSEISYLRRLNLQLVEQHMKAEKAREILKEVKEAQETFKKQRETIKLEAECDSWKVKVHEQERKISDLEHQLDGQKVTIKILQAEKDHALLLTQHAQEQRPATSYLRPRSAEVARKPNYRISGIMKPRSTVSGQFPSVHETDFSIMLPVLNSSQGTKVDILNLEESHHAQAPLTLGPMVVTDDEAGYSGSTVRESEAKLSRPQRVQKLRNRGHRRTASTGSNINVNVLPPSSSVKEKDNVFSSNVPHFYPTKQKVPKHPSRPGSAGSTRPDITQILRIDSPEQITETAQAVSEYMSKLIGSHSSDLNETSETVAETRENGDAKWTGGGESRKQSQGSVTGQPGQQGVKTKHPKYSEMTRSKPANKSTDSNGTTSSEGTSTSSHSDPATKLSNDSANQTLPNDSTDRTNQKLEKPQILFRTESMSSTGSTFSLSGPGLPSRNPSFVYDGGESSTYSHESLEIGDSVENLQTFGRLGYYPFIVPIRGHHKHETTTSSSEDEREYWAGRRKRSSGTTVESSTPHRKDDNSNSSCDSDQLQRGGGYHANEEPAIPVHRTESISISDMEKCPTDVEMEDKVASLHKSFGRVRHSSTGSVKICYSESSNTSMEDVSKNV